MTTKIVYGLTRPHEHIPHVIVTFILPIISSNKNVILLENGNECTRVPTKTAPGLNQNEYTTTNLVQ